MFSHAPESKSQTFSRIADAPVMASLGTRLNDGPIPTSISQIRRQAAEPVIARFRTALANIQASELERLYGRLPQLDDHSRESIRQFADNLLAAVLHPPLESLRNESGSPQYLLDALQRLFRLDDTLLRPQDVFNRGTQIADPAVIPVQQSVAR